MLIPFLIQTLIFKISLNFKIFLTFSAFKNRNLEVIRAKKLNLVSKNFFFLFYRALRII